MKQHSVVYDPLTGDVTLDAPYGKKPIGTKVGWISDQGYAMFFYKGKPIRVHRFAWFVTYGFWPTVDIDHINGVRSDYRIENLRLVDRAGNMQNMKKAHIDNNSGLAGVSCIKGRYFFARICIDGKTRHLGSFKTAEEAHKAYIHEKKKIHDKYVP